MLTSDGTRGERASGGVILTSFTHLRRRCGSHEATADQTDATDFAFLEAVLRHGKLAHEEALETPVVAEFAIGRAGHDRVPPEGATAVRRVSEAETEWTAPAGREPLHTT